MFIDPANIFISQDKWSLQAQAIIMDYFRNLIQAYFDLSENKGTKEAVLKLFDHIEEPSGVMLGYSAAGNGRMLSPEKLFNTFKDLQKLSSKGVKVEHIGNIRLSFPGLGADGLTDLIISLLRKVLNDFTYAECEILDIPVSKFGDVSNVWSWSLDSKGHGDWKASKMCMLKYESNPVLLIPKHWIRDSIYHPDNVNAIEHIVREILSVISDANPNFSKEVSKIIKKAKEPKAEELANDIIKYHNELCKFDSAHFLSNGRLDNLAGIKD